MRTKGLSKMEKQRISDIVNSLLTEFGYDSKVDTYVNIVKLAASAGLLVGESKKMHLKDDGFIYFPKDNSQPIICVNNDRSVENKRFIVAHELAHYFMHQKGTVTQNVVMRRERRKGKDNDENDADFFAACILMPAESFRQQYQRLKAQGLDASDIVDCLQIIFKTPTESIERRIEEVC